MSMGPGRKLGTLFCLPWPATQTESFRNSNPHKTMLTYHTQNTVGAIIRVTACFEAVQ